MDFVAAVDQAIALLRQRGRLTYRTLQLQLRHCQVVETDAITGQQRTHFGLDAHRLGP